ncbi:hypothetical protein A3A03_01760 [Candidatus Nomurabacteria bacterium RIFCSPLOWO2_01_FULL_40_18]|uniref:AbiEi antitoxin C-terminal domain-containing protein n=1 Tax=Candidatus Nomurabacteria bacterium RIFCSPLOWO2_01_FULL_40_18 TaxID=1801773 RepID=A0A1F6XLT1_9BACT|nr:MAG: hypothetical protein A3A03_01760 [Candidatus Nomurabacteria bacterium RIFCSPLOWO2_01_FULL_40_18]
MINNDKKLNKISRNRRFADLAVLGDTVFHINDLANLWNIRDRNTLRKTLSRYVAAGLIHRIHRGFYSLKNLRDIDAYSLGLKAIHRFAYISCESVLSDNGIINQSPTEITLVSDISRRYKIGDLNFRSRRLTYNFLYNDVGILNRNDIRIATVERAVADMLYFNPRAYFDASTSKLINWKAVKNIATKIGYNIKIPS